MLILLLSLVLTLDDLPMPATTLFSPEERAEITIETLHRHHLTVSFFVIGDQVGDGNVLQRLSEEGHMLSNHTVSHPHFSQLDVDGAVAEVAACHQTIESYPTFRPYFRYPYLDFGGAEKGPRLAHAIGEMGYRHGYVTINTFDWAIQALLDRELAEGREVDFEKLGDFYVGMIVEWAAFYKEMRPEIEVHVLLLHANDLSALYLDRLLTELADAGWEWAHPEEAFEGANDYLADFSQFAKLLAHPKPFQTPPTLNLPYLKQAFAERVRSAS